MKLSELKGGNVELKIEGTDIVVMIKQDVPYGQWVESMNVEDPGQRASARLAAQIESWNIETEEGIPMPVTAASVAMLPLSIVRPMIAETNRLQQERTEKKTTSQSA